MDNTEILATKYNKANAYLVKEVMDSSPQKLLLKVYDFAITHCQKENIEKSNRAVAELINALNFEDDSARGLSLELLRLYQFVQERTRNGEFDLSLQILTELRDTWQEAFTTNIEVKSSAN